MWDLDRLKRIAETPQTVWTHQTIQGVPTSEVILSLVAMVEASEAQLRWRPISTAPKDGESFLSFRAPAGPVAVTQAYDFPEGEMWRVSGLAFRPDLRPDVARSVMPTHWMPLPPPPAIND
jgi:hypothetical protein